MTTIYFLGAVTLLYKIKEGGDSHIFPSITPFFLLSSSQNVPNTQSTFINHSRSISHLLHYPSCTYCFFLKLSISISISRTPSASPRTYSVQHAPRTCQHRRQYSPSSPFRTLRCPHAQHIQTHCGGSCSSPIVSRRAFESRFIALGFCEIVCSGFRMFERRSCIEEVIFVARCYFIEL
jgi:hypothetical protein